MIKISEPWIGEKEKNEVIKVIESGMLVQGEKVKEFEDRFKEYLGVKNAIAVNSGTAALHLALLSLGLKKDDEVITSAFSFIASANSVKFCNGKVVFVDIGDDYNIDVSKIKEKISEKTKVIMPVHLYGNPCDMDEIMKIAKENKLNVVEDCCQAHGAEYKNKKVGSIGEVGCFSFYPSKNMTTGEGGMIVTNDDGIAEKCRLLRNHGSKKKYRHEVLGYNYRMMDLNAVIGIEQLKRLDEFNNKRRENAEYYNKNLGNVVKPVVDRNKKHVFHQYTIRVKDRDEIIKKLEEKGIGYGVYYDKPIYKQKVYSGEYEELENTEKMSKEVISLPVHPKLSKEDLDKVIEVLK